jgi:hypothetical protein
MLLQVHIGRDGEIQVKQSRKASHGEQINEVIVLLEGNLGNRAVVGSSTWTWCS